MRDPVACPCPREATRVTISSSAGTYRDKLTHQKTHPEHVLPHVHEGRMFIDAEGVLITHYPSTRSGVYLTQTFRWIHISTQLRF